MTGLLRIAFLTPWNIDDQHAWSGIVAPMYRALSQVADVVPISTSGVSAARTDRALARIIGTATRRQYLWDFGVTTARVRGRVSTRRIEAARVDAVFAVAASVDVAFLRGLAPVVQYVDATFGAMRDEYPVFTHVHPLSAMQVRYVGERANRRTSRFVAASQWAVDALARDAVGTEVCTIAPPGAAIEPTGTRVTRSDGPLRALLVASDWQRKGGDQAVAAVQLARGRGVDVQLRVVGDAPHLPDGSIRLGRLDHDALSVEYLHADVLLEPARANAAGVTLTDAAAHGLPVIATRTGGVSDIVIDGQTGWLLDSRNEVPQHLADRLAALDTDPAGLRAASVAARVHYESALAWPVWADSVVRSCAAAVRGRQEGLR